jgi:peroxiredoxin
MVLIQSNSTVLKIGDPMPPFSLPSVDGSTVHSQNIRAGTVAVIFTCNHCPYAQAYEDRLKELAEEFRGEDVEFVLINSNDASDYPEDSFENMKVRASEKEFPFLYCLDETQGVAKDMGALCTPHCFVFDARRTLQYKGRVDDNWKEPEKVKHRDLHDAIEALSQGKIPPVQEANAIGCSIKWKKGNEPTMST